MKGAREGPRPAAVTFDVDGTLYDAGRQQIRLWRAFLRHPRILGGWPEVFASLRGERHDDLWAEAGRRLSARVGGRPEDAEAVVRAVLLERWPQTFHPGLLFSGIHEALAALDAWGIPRAVVSDYPSRAKLRALGVGEGWSAVIDCSALGALKPLPDGLEAAAAALGVPASAIVHIGDRADTDGGAAEAAGAVALIRGRDYPDEGALVGALESLFSEDA